MRSSSMQPPDTEPTTAPSSASAMMEPMGRGEEPQVRTTVASSARLPACRQSRSVRKTITSRFSIASPFASEGVHRVRAQQPGTPRRRFEIAPVRLVHDHRAYIVLVGDVVQPQEFPEGPAVAHLGKGNAQVEHGSGGGEVAVA